MGKILRCATAGTLESSDIFVSMEPNTDGIDIEIESVVLKQFGDDIRRVTTEVLQDNDITCAKVSIVDRGALECVIRARVETAIVRGKGENA